MHGRVRTGRLRASVGVVAVFAGAVGGAGAVGAAPVQGAPVAIVTGADFDGLTDDCRSALVEFIALHAQLADLAEQRVAPDPELHVELAQRGRELSAACALDEARAVSAFLVAAAERADSEPGLRGGYWESTADNLCLLAASNPDELELTGAATAACAAIDVVVRARFAVDGPGLARPSEPTQTVPPSMSETGHLDVRTLTAGFTSWAIGEGMAVYAVACDVNDTGELATCYGRYDGGPVLAAISTDAAVWTRLGGDDGG